MSNEANDVINQVNQIKPIRDEFIIDRGILDIIAPLVTNNMIDGEEELMLLEAIFFYEFYGFHPNYLSPFLMNVFEIASLYCSDVE
ncbi:MAG: hypothetical protein LUG60_00260 [Erysipelotrichaceae bacterium]|nr:hypothetical protein [Erysipelotrichaceae bacterium]